MKYRTIVADPPWDHSDGTGTTLVNGSWKGSSLPYDCLSLEAICDLPVCELAARDAYYVAEAWGFAVVKPLVWVKEPKGFMGRPYTSTAEFCLYARRGVLRAQGDAGRQWWLWPRSDHSAKPEAFLDIVERVSPGPYLRSSCRFSSRRSGVHQSAIFCATSGRVLPLRQLWRLPRCASLIFARCSGVRSYGTEHERHIFARVG